MKNKYDRRRAVDCKLERTSSSNPGYFKYNVTIREKDGTVHTEPCYGKDMQDALSRLINTERTQIVEKKVMNNPLLFFLLWITLMAWPVLLTQTHNTPWFVLYMFGGVAGLFIIGAWWQHYLEKGK